VGTQARAKNLSLLACGDTGKGKNLSLACGDTGKGKTLTNLSLLACGDTGKGNIKTKS
jgi:hypothetical protein